MSDLLSPEQHEVVFNQNGLSVVHACPGSGKTFTVAARLGHRIKQWMLPHQGIAALSFTNVACAEIKHKLETYHATSVYYPHFLGTIDSFVNRFIFLPFGHLIMNCKFRPVLVGEPYGSWNYKLKYERDCAQYFDKTSYDINNELIQTADYRLFKFKWKLTNKNGSENKNIINIKLIKKELWEQGFATQDDANYIAMKVMEKFPDIARAIVYRFPELIIDEAQDTSEIQMRIIDLLVKNGMGEIMLVGDPDQAIFEWRNAKPELFENKCTTWPNSAVLNDNWRSSQLICNCTYKLSCLGSTSTAVNKDVKDFGGAPTIVTYAKDSIQATIDFFLDLCHQHKIAVNPENVAILYRSKTFGAQINGARSLTFKEKPWLSDALVVSDFAEGKYRYDNSKFKDGFKKIESALLKYIFNKEFYSARELKELTDKIGFANWRKMLWIFINHMPPAQGCLTTWIEAMNTDISLLNHYKKIIVSLEKSGFKVKNKGLSMRIDKSKGNVSFDDLFVAELPSKPAIPYRFGTVHSVKGETFEAVLLFLNEKAANNSLYKNLLKAKKISDKGKEELRIVYVAITRPSKILVVAVLGSDDKAAWEKKLGVEQLW
ncbi:MAG: ATP-dependent helicase [Clostridia bacterium]|nr:ATP-dependent helicase [Clostridia bacterium]